MAAEFDSNAVVDHGWRQGAVLGPALAARARACAPPGVAFADDDWLILTSHDCDIQNGSLRKEPFVEIIRAEVMSRGNHDRQQAWGRNPRTLRFPIEDGKDSPVLRCHVHERWMLPRELLATEAPLRFVSDKARRVIAEWLAKRYIRSAFPTAFDLRWRRKAKEWTIVLERHSAWLQGVYLRLSTLAELGQEVPYKCHIILAVPASQRGSTDWATRRETLEREISRFWEQFRPGIDCVEVEVLGTDEVTLADIEPYQRFDADWISFGDNTESAAAITDLTS